jgi:hypothetical protein
LLPDANLNFHVIFLSLLVNDLVDSLDTNVNILSLLRNAKINSFDAHVNSLDALVNFLTLLSHAFLIFLGLLPQVSHLLNNTLLAQPLSVTLDFFDHALPLLSLSIFAALN